jgi:tRNA A-37 threonylcarbamoyl transferase component Bud32
VLALLQNDKEETILSRDSAISKRAVIDPLGLNRIKKDADPGAIGRIIFNSKGRAGLAFLVLALVFGLLGFLVVQKTKATLAQIRGEESVAILNSNVETLNYWIENYKQTTEMVVASTEISEEIELLVAGDSTQIDQLQENLNELLKHTKAFSFLFTDLNGNIILSSIKDLVGERVNDRFGKQVFSAAGGKAQFILPFYEEQRDNRHLLYTDKPLVWMQVPVYNSAGNIVATFGIGRKADDEFTKILRTARMGKSGETYAINKDGWFISESRFENEMRAKGTMHTDTNVSSILNVRARKQSYKLSHDILPLTDLANLVIASAEAKSDVKSGVLTEPSEDYKGVQVIGAWAWLPNYEFGVISQVDAKEAFAPIKYLYALIVGAILFLLIASGFSFYNAWQLAHMQGALTSAAQMGQYELKKLIEEGGMGAVYLAEHRLLKRPTAIKVIRVDKKDENLVKRFEREVHLASQLTHPNTVEIYDYGFTQDGQAYFAMEFINGVNLSAEVQKFGPMPPGRVVHIIKQVCGSLLEAHAMGMVHRDIKPQNVMLTNRIGLPDFVKVLDFGLAKPQYEVENEEETRAITGTPVYISPERLKRPGLAEPSGDIYAIGALMYYLLSGKPIYSYSSNLDILYQVLNDAPKPLPENVPEVLIKLTFFCLEKDPDERPSSIEELKMFVDNLSAEFPWSRDDVEGWQQKRNA